MIRLKKATTKSHSRTIRLVQTKMGKRSAKPARAGTDSAVHAYDRTSLKQASKDYDGRQLHN